MRTTKFSFLQIDSELWVENWKNLHSVTLDLRIIQVE